MRLAHRRGYYAPAGKDMKYRIFYPLAAICFFAMACPSLPAFSASQTSKDEQKLSPKKEDRRKPVDDDQVIKLGTQLITVPFNVTDKENRFINDLTKDDIEILEDNKPQEISSYERQTDMALTIAMLIDISGSMEQVLPEEVSAGKRFFEKILRPRKDLGAVVTFEHESVLVQDLTSNVERLKHALDGVRVPVIPTRHPGGRGTPPINGDYDIGSTAMYDSIYATSADLLSPEAGRRVIILLTDGVDTSSQVKMKDAIERAWKSEIILYAIGIGFDDVNEGTLKRIAKETGGRAFFPRDEEDLDIAYRQIEEDLRAQNLLTYQPTNDANDGSFRTIQVRIKNRKDLTVRHRRGYFAKKNGV